MPSAWVGLAALSFFGFWFMKLPIRQKRTQFFSCVTRVPVSLKALLLSHFQIKGENEEQPG